MMLIYGVLAVGLIILWLWVGQYEWELPDALSERIEAFGTNNTRQVKTITDNAVLAIEAREFDYEDIEKEIYMVRKTRNRQEGIIVSIDLSQENANLPKDEQERTKTRLERRFPGLTVQYTQKG
ncbi:hypothetical protein UNSWDHB_1285 [Dehalobacter sp. UNSWDHB]|jgi:hypothetical protein|uniref:hypothetical protein n=1 Tax=unclassified Dehalobacter TaxID=2635733 RepID=UPI00028A9DCE|nr:MULTISPECIES: hypothetical protein [unclassified Dehalobacter]AFV03885.1 hypothetical protein DHBDCA_p2858 [Dehalobacter sp. DCA]AFV06863.1 hypothetical protein DCF50_p2860 [Dehalobacter sp. CF]EQB21381.1 hypothetical protein UNSWDHB_1285 [Dehalobacter sp. UNSWDHB]MCG1024674.1 hypothetical protein [Dehalobacter sp.]